MNSHAAGSRTERVEPLIALGESTWREGAAFEVRSPWDDALVAEVPAMSPTDVKAVLDWGAAQAPTVADWPILDRVATLHRWADALEAHAEDLAVTETIEMGKTIRQSRPGLVAQAQRIRALCAEAATLDQTSVDGWQPGTGAVPMNVLGRREPLGLAVGFLPFNSPVAALVWKTVPALLTGNPVVIKLSSQAPVAALRAAHLLHREGLPDGALQVIAGERAGMLEEFAGHPAVRKISFTGGTLAGSVLWRSSAGTMPRLTLECGSNDPAVVLDDADIALAARTVVEYGIRFYNGQLCTAPKRCLVSAQVHDEFLDAVRAEAEAVVMGDPLDGATELGPLVSVAAAREVERAVHAGVAAGARVVIGGERVSGAVVPPTVVADVTPDNPLFRDGPFGPVLNITRFETDGDAATLANTSPYGLRAAIFSADRARAMQLAYGLDFGGVAINGPATVGEPTISVDPRKQSGVGSEGIHTSLLEFTQPKFIWTNADESAATGR